MKKYDVTAIGELLIDFTENGYSSQGNHLFEANPGGAPCNVLAMLSRLGRKTAFIGKVGDDYLGKHLKEVIEKLGIDAQNLLLDHEVHTTLAFVHTLPDGDRDFSFYRNPGADMRLQPEEINTELIRQSRIFHFGSLSMTHSCVREATKKALSAAKEGGCLLSFDPNLRVPLWDSPEEAREQIAFGMSRCDILKISDNELQWFTGREDYEEGIAALRRQYPISLILLSLGREGSRAYAGSSRAEVPSLLQEKTVETTGAGDTFCACALNYILDHGVKGLSDKELQEMLCFANAAASLITTKKGALKVMPERPEIERLLKERGYGD